MNTTGMGNTGMVQVRVLPLSDTQFRYPKPKNPLQAPPLHNFKVLNTTKIELMVGNQGAFKKGAFNNLQEGDRVIILTKHNPNNGNNQNNNGKANNANNNANAKNNGIATSTAEAIEVFPSKKKQQVALAP